MKTHVLVVILVAVYARAVHGTCNVGEWSDWCEWRSAKNRHELAHSFPAGPYDPSAVPSVGRNRTLTARAENTDSKVGINTCLNAGAFPDITSQTQDGPFQCVGGVAGGMQCSNMHQLDWVGLDQLIGGAGNDVWGWTDTETGKEWAIMGSEAGVTFIDVSTPTDVQVVATMATQTTNSTCRDMKTLGDWVWVVSEADDHGIQGFDMKRLRTESGRLAPSVYHGDIDNCRNVVASEDTEFIYAMGCSPGFNSCSGGVYAVNVANPTNPVNVACYGGYGYIHDAQCLIYRGPDIQYVNREICFCYTEDTLSILNVHDKGFIHGISRTGYPNVGYTHQGWITEDFQYALMGDEMDEQPGTGLGFTLTYIWDITSLDAPVLVNVYQAVFQSVDHNQYIVGDLVYQANYESGLRVLRLVGTDLTEIAYFDVFPLRDAAQFNGAFSVYPFFSSGTILVSSINDGLYVVELDTAAIEAQKDVKPRSQRSRSREIFEADNIEICPPLTEYELA